MQTSIRMTSVIRHPVQLEDEIAALKKDVDTLKAQVLSDDTELKKLTDGLNSYKSTFEEANKVVKEVETLRDSNKKIQTSLDAALIERNEAQKVAEDLKAKVDGATKKYKASRHKLRKAEAKLQKAWEEWLAEWKLSPDGLNYLGRISSTSYCLGTRETKERLRAIQIESNPVMDSNAMDAEFDHRVASEQRSGGRLQAPGASRIQGSTLESVVVATKVTQAGVTADPEKVTDARDKIEGQGSRSAKLETSEEEVGDSYEGTPAKDSAP